MGGAPTLRGAVRRIVSIVSHPSVTYVDGHHKQSARGALTVLTEALQRIVPLRPNAGDAAPVSESRREEVAAFLPASASYASSAHDHTIDSCYMRIVQIDRWWSGVEEAFDLPCSFLSSSRSICSNCHL